MFTNVTDVITLYSSVRNFQRKLKVYVLHNDVMYTVISDGH